MWELLQPFKSKGQATHRRERQDSTKGGTWGAVANATTPESLIIDGPNFTDGHFTCLMWSHPDSVVCTSVKIIKEPSKIHVSQMSSMHVCWGMLADATRTSL